MKRYFRHDGAGKKNGTRLTALTILAESGDNIPPRPETSDTSQRARMKHKLRKRFAVPAECKNPLPQYGNNARDGEGVINGVTGGYKELDKSNPHHTACTSSNERQGEKISQCAEMTSRASGKQNRVSNHPRYLMETSDRG